MLLPVVGSLISQAEREVAGFLLNLGLALQLLGIFGTNHSRVLDRPMICLLRMAQLSTARCSPDHELAWSLNSGEAHPSPVGRKRP